MENRERETNSEDEINLLELLKTIWPHKKMIIRFVVFFGLIGLVITIFSEEKYTASTIVVPQVSNAKVQGGLGGLAAMAGINVSGGGSSEAIPPSLYPKIAQSIPFQKELLNTPLKFSDLEEEVTYKQFYEKYRKTSVLAIIKSYTIGLPNRIIDLFKSKSNNENKIREKEEAIYRVSEKENNLFNQLQKQLVISNNSKDGFIKITFSMSQALPSAQMAKKTQELLQEAIINFKLQKTKEEFNFIEERYTELKKDFEKKQIILANFRDRNQGLITSRSQSRLEKFRAEYNLSYTVYSELAKQLESKKIKLKEKTPVFTIIEPVSIPVEKTNSKKGMTLVIWLFLGLVFGVCFVFFRIFFNNLKENIKEL